MKPVFKQFDFSWSQHGVVCTPTLKGGALSFLHNIADCCAATVRTHPLWVPLDGHPSLRVARFDAHGFVGMKGDTLFPVPLVFKQEGHGVSVSDAYMADALESLSAVLDTTPLATPLHVHSAPNRWQSPIVACDTLPVAAWFAGRVVEQPALTMVMGALFNRIGPLLPIESGTTVSLDGVMFSNQAPTSLNESLKTLAFSLLNQGVLGSRVCLGAQALSGDNTGTVCLINAPLVSFSVTKTLQQSTSHDIMNAKAFVRALNANGIVLDSPLLSH